MNTIYYQNFVEIIEAETLSAAAQKLHVSQPALSNQLRMLEEEYGTELVTRSVHGIELTSAGRIVYEKAKNICRLEEEAKRHVKDASLGLRGTLSISIAPSAPDLRLWDLIFAFSRENPEVQFEFHESTSYSAIEKLYDGVADIAIVRKSSNISPRLHVWYSVEEPLVVVFPKGSDWLDSTAGSIDITALKDIPLSIPRGMHSTIWDAALAAGFYPHFISVCSYRDTALRWAKEGLSAAILSAPTPEECANTQLDCLPLTSVAIPKYRLIATARDREPSLQTSAFISWCGEHLVGWDTGILHER